MASDIRDRLVFRLGNWCLVWWNKVLAIWLIFGGAVCLLLLATLQWQNAVANSAERGEKKPDAPALQDGGLGGAGGGGEIFGSNGKIIGGKGGNVGPGGIGRGGDGGGGVIHGDGGVIIGGEGGSVDGTHIWYPPAQSGYIQFLESEGKTPDFGVQYPGAGGASDGWAARQQIVEKIRDGYFRDSGQTAKLTSSKIEDVPLRYINEKLDELGFPWRAQIDKKYWYLYYVP